MPLIPPTHTLNNLNKVFIAKMGLELKYVIGRIISLQSMRYPGSFLDSWREDSKVVHVK